MDQQDPHARGRSLSVNSTNRRSHINNSHSPEPTRFPEAAPPSIGLGHGVDPALQQFPGAQPDYSTYNSNSSAFLSNQQAQSFSQPGLVDPSASFDPNHSFTQQLAEDNPSFGTASQGGFLGQDFNQDFTIYPPTSGEQYSNAPLFPDKPQLGGGDSNMMAQASHSATPPHLLKPEPPSANHSPNFNQHQFSPSPGRHSRNVSLGPEAALLPGQVDWTQAAQFQGHRRSPSEYSDVSSVAPSPHLASTDNFDQLDHSPMQRPQDAGVYQELHGIGSFSLSEHGSHSPHHPAARSPSHSPAVSPRIHPQQVPDMNDPNQFMLRAPNSYGPPPAYIQAPEAFPQLQTGGDMGGMMVPPAINIDYAPVSSKNGFEQPKSVDTDSLLPPEQRGRPRQRPRAVTDPFNSRGTLLSTRPGSNSLSPSAAADRSESSRSLSPLDRSSVSPSRRRQSTSAVPNNVIALRLADPEYNGPGAQGENGAGGAKRVQKHPATFQCTLCPKRFTRAYNLRSHLRTHTDERPFVCTVCGKAFARQHDRKRHEGLHSGEKKFVCKGDLKAGGQWGCGRRFARADALGRHFRSEAGRICITPLLDEEMLERQRVWNEQRMQQAAAHGMVMQAPSGLMMPHGMGGDPNAPPAYPMDPSGQYALPAALLAQYPALAQMNWAAPEMSGGGGVEDEMSGRSSFDASDYDENDDAGYVSGPGTGFGPGGMQEGFGEVGYASDYGGR